MLMVVVLVFVLCNVLAMVSNLLDAFGIEVPMLPKVNPFFPFIWIYITYLAICIELLQDKHTQNVIYKTEKIHKIENFLNINLGQFIELIRYT